MVEVVTCPECGTRNLINPEKHKYREKLCRVCRTPIANLSPKRRVLSFFQRRKRERHEQTRKRFIDRMLAKKMSMKDIEKRLCKRFEGED